jgi:hypothetical protein
MEALKHNFLLSGYFRKRGYEDSASLTANKISGLPLGTPMKTFTYTAKQLFDARDSAKLRNHKSLDAGGEFLAENQFGYAVVVVSTGMEGDAQKNQVLTDARAMVVREYLVENYGFDDSLLKTMGMGKQTSTSLESDWGSIQILIFPVGTEMPVNRQAPAVSSPAANSDSPAQITSAASQKQ